MEKKVGDVGCDVRATVTDGDDGSPVRDTPPGFQVEVRPRNERCCKWAENQKSMIFVPQCLVDFQVEVDWKLTGSGL